MALILYRIMRLKLKAANPDILHHIARDQDAILFWRQAREQNLEVKDPAERAQRIAMLRDTCKDPVKAREYLLNSSMINSIRRVATID